MCYRTVLKCNISETAIKNNLCILIFCKAPVKSKILNIFMILWHITNELWEYLSIILMSVTCKVFDIRCNDHACARGRELSQCLLCHYWLRRRWLLWWPPAPPVAVGFSAVEVPGSGCVHACSLHFVNCSLQMYNLDLVMSLSCFFECFLFAFYFYFTFSIFNFFNFSFIYNTMLTQ